MADRHQPGCTIDLRSEVVAVALVGLAGVHPHTHGREVRGTKGELRVLRGRDRVPRLGEGHCETVATGGKGEPAVQLERILQDRVVMHERGLHRHGIALPQTRRTFDVREEERDPAGGSVRRRHEWSPAIELSWWHALVGTSGVRDYTPVASTVSN